VLLDGPLQLYDSDPTDFPAMDTLGSQTQWDHDQSQPCFRFGNQNALVQEGFTPFSELMVSPNSDGVVLFDASEVSNYANEELDVKPGSLLDHSLQSTQIQHRRIPPQIRNPPVPSTAQKPRTRRSPRTYPTPPSSLHDESDNYEYKLPLRKSPSRKPPTQRPKPTTTTKRRNGHIPGINRQTGQLTVIGRYPPLILEPSLYACPKCWSSTDHANSSWHTRNGYKYHLNHVCLGNPQSTASIRKKVAEEAGLEPVRVSPRKKDVLRQCGECDSWFKSEAGYKSHRETNVTTRHGLCRTKGWRGRGAVVEQAAPVAVMAAQQMAEVPQMGPSQIAVRECDAREYFVWQDAWTAVHGNFENSVTEGIEAGASMEPEE
jgi:hypothetical protein